MTRIRDYKEIMEEIMSENPESKNKCVKFVESMCDGLKEAIQEDVSTKKPYSASLVYKLRDHGLSKLETRYVIKLINDAGWLHSDVWGDDSVDITVFV
jgi:hypothetical protein